MRTALIVDDNPDIRFLLSQAFTRKGFVIEQAENGQVAQEKLLGGSKPCLIILDLMMPVMDGKQFLDWKNAHSDFMNIPVLVISATGISKSLSGTHGYLQKPVDIKKVLKFAEDYCGQGEIA